MVMLISFLILLSLLVVSVSNVLIPSRRLLTHPLERFSTVLSLRLNLYLHSPMPRFKLVFFSPTKDTSRILNHIFSKYPKNVGKIGEYEHCAFVTRGTGQFRPGPEAHPHIGTPGELEFVEEDRVETLVVDRGQNEEVKGVIRELKSVRRILCLSSSLGYIITHAYNLIRCTHMKKLHTMFINWKSYEIHESFR